MPTVFLSAASVDLKPWRDILHGAFSRAGFRVLTQAHSLGAAPGDVRRLLTEHIDESDCVIHLAGMGYGSDAQDPFPKSPGFVCSWTQYEYYYAHSKGKDVIAFVCAPDLSTAGFKEEGDAAECGRKSNSQLAHRERVASGNFDDTPLAGKSRTLNEKVESVGNLVQAVAAAVGRLHKHPQEAQQVKQQLHQLSFRYQLPPLPPIFVGRDDDRKRLRTIDPGQGALITGLRGMGGIGKSALAVVTAHEWKSRFPDAQFFLDGRGTQADPPTAAVLLSQVIQVYHPEANLPDDLAALQAIYLQLLADQRVLIVLDNAKDARQVAPLAPPSGCGLIVTSRQNFVIGKSALVQVGKLLNADAAALLREYYADLTDVDAANLVELCAGLPLALRLAGSHLALDASERGGVPDVAVYIDRLRGGRLKTLDAEAADAAEVTISETLRLSEDQLKEAERTTWRKLGVFGASFDAAAALAIAGADEGLLGRLVRRSLLERDGDGRYKLHDMAAEYARDRLQEIGEFDETHLVHAEHYSRVGGVTDKLYLAGNAVEGLALFDRERAQIEGAFGWIAGRNDQRSDKILLDLLNGIAYTSSLRIHPRQRIAWLEAQRDAAKRLGNRQWEGSTLGNLGLAHAALGDALRAIEYYEQHLVIAREFGDRRGEGNSLGNLGNAHHGLGDVRRAIECHEQALVISREVRDRRAEGQDLGNLGVAHTALGDARRAIEYHEKSLVIAREIGDRRGEGSALGNLGLAHAGLGDARRAIEYYEQQLIIVREIGDRQGEGNSLGNLGIAHADLGDARRAIEYCEQQFVIAREIGDRRGEGNSLGNLGNAHAALGDARRAIEYYEQRLVLAREIGDRRGEGNALFNSAVSHWNLGNCEEATAHAAAALRIHEAIESPTAAKVRKVLAEWRAKQ